MKRNGCAYLFYLVVAVAILVGIFSSQKGNRTVLPTTTPKPAVISDGLSAYLDEAETLAKKLGTEKLSDTKFNAFKEKYAQEDYTAAYQYYQSHENDMRKSCWAMNNVGLAMMQLGQYDDALTLYYAIHLKTKGSQPESLINLLVAGHALGFGPAELLDAAGMDAKIFAGILKEKKYSANHINSMIETLCYNVVYMRMEEEAVGRSLGTSSAELNINALFTAPDPYPKLMTELRTLSDDDEDVQALLAYFEALLDRRKEIFSF